MAVSEIGRKLGQPQRLPSRSRAAFTNSARASEHPRSLLLHHHEFTMECFRSKFPEKGRLDPARRPLPRTNDTILFFNNLNKGTLGHRKNKVSQIRDLLTCNEEHRIITAHKLGDTIAFISRRQVERDQIEICFTRRRQTLCNLHLPTKAGESYGASSNRPCSLSSKTNGGAADVPRRLSYTLSDTVSPICNNIPPRCFCKRSRN